MRSQFINRLLFYVVSIWFTTGSFAQVTISADSNSTIVFSQDNNDSCSLRSWLISSQENLASITIDSLYGAGFIGVPSTWNFYADSIASENNLILSYEAYLHPFTYENTEGPLHNEIVTSSNNTLLIQFEPAESSTYCGEAYISASAHVCDASVELIIQKDKEIICGNDSITFSYTGDSTYSNYKWFRNDELIEPSNGAYIQTKNSFRTSRSGTYQLQIYLDSCTYSSNKMRVGSEDSPDLALYGWCDTSLIISSAYPSGWLYSLSSADTIILADTNRLVVLSSNYYILQVSDSVTGCTLSSDSIYVSIDKRPEKPEIEHSEFLSLCDGEPIELSCLNDSISWNTGEKNSTILISAPGLYYVESHNDNCSRTSDTISIGGRIFNNGIHIPDDSLCVGQSIEVYSQAIDDHLEDFSNTTSSIESNNGWTVEVEESTGGAIMIGSISSNRAHFSLYTNDLIHVGDLSPASLYSPDTLSIEEGTQFSFDIEWNEFDVEGEVSLMLKASPSSNWTTLETYHPENYNNIYTEEYVFNNTYEDAQLRFFVGIYSIVFFDNLRLSSSTYSEQELNYEYTWAPAELFSNSAEPISMFSAQENTQVSLLITDTTYGCSNLLQANLFVSEAHCEGTGISDTELQMFELQVSPTVSSYDLNILTENLSSICVLNAQGVPVINKELNTGNNTIDISSLNPGFYVIYGQKDHRIYRGRFIKE